MPEIHQAYFGAVGGVSHGELASSLANQELRAYLSGITDKPALPLNYELTPYLTADNYAGYYLLSRTWPDLEAPRGGLVFTHVLMVPVALVTKIDELGQLLGLLLAAPPSVAARTQPLAPLLVSEAQGRVQTAEAPDYPASWREVLRQMLEAGDEASVYVSGAETQFTPLLEALWRGIPAETRPQLSWGVRFVAPTRPDASPHLVRVPPELAPRWHGPRLVPVEADNLGPPDSPAARLIFTPGRAVDFQAFLAELEVATNSFLQLRRCQRAFELSASLRQDQPAAGPLLALVRTLKQTQPDPEKARVLKRRAVLALAIALPESAAEINSLRNLDEAAFAPADVAVLVAAVEHSVQKLVGAAETQWVPQGELLGFLAELPAPGQQAWWRAAAESGFTRALANPAAAAAGLVWRAIAQSALVRDFILRVLPVGEDWETQLQQACPAELSQALAEALTAYCVGRGWWDLLATIFEATYPAANALRKIVAAERSLLQTTSPRVARVANRVTGWELVKLALESAESQLLELAGQRAASEPDLLADLDVLQPAWRRIWAAALSYTRSLTLGLLAAEQTITAFLSEVAAGQAKDQLPLELIADSTYANVLDLPQRPQLWDRLPQPLLPRFAVATLGELAKRLLAGAELSGLTDLLPYAQQADFVVWMTQNKRHDLAAWLQVDAQLHFLTDDVLRSHLLEMPTVQPVVAAQAGQLILEHRWRHSADALLARAKKDVSFRPGLRECSTMFSVTTRLLSYWAFDGQLTIDDIWQAFADCLTELYPDGPDQGNIWRRAGGDSSWLRNQASRREQWSEALRLLRQGGGGPHISFISLLDRAQEDFNANLTLQKLREFITLQK